MISCQENSENFLTVHYIILNFSPMSYNWPFKKSIFIFTFCQQCLVFNRMDLKKYGLFTKSRIETLRFFTMLYFYVQNDSASFQKERFSTFRVIWSPILNMSTIEKRVQSINFRSFTVRVLLFQRSHLIQFCQDRLKILRTYSQIAVLQNAIKK